MVRRRGTRSHVLQPVALRTPVLLLCLWLTAVLLTACATAGLDATRQDQLRALLPADIVLLGEQHDAAEHHGLEHGVVQALVRRNALAALVVEMAERGRDTTGLPTSASAAQVRRALAWNDAGWPWSAYGPAIMAAVRAGVPVLGGNLPHARMRPAMQETELDRLLSAAALAVQHERIREGHCNTLPEARIAPMARIQVARDRSLAGVALQRRRPGRTVLVIAGNGHVERGLGVPVHLPGSVRVAVISMRAGAPSGDHASSPAVDLLWQTPATPPHDYCGRLRAQPAAR